MSHLVQNNNNNSKCPELPCLMVPILIFNRDRKKYFRNKLLTNSIEQTINAHLKNKGKMY